MLNSVKTLCGKFTKTNDNHTLATFPVHKPVKTENYVFKTICAEDTFTDIFF